MATASSTSPSLPPESPQTPAANSEDNLELNKDLERMIEDMESMAGPASPSRCFWMFQKKSNKSDLTIHPKVQLTWMAYDMVALRTNPELVASLQKLRDGFQRSKAVLGE